MRLTSLVVDEWARAGRSRRGPPRTWAAAGCEAVRRRASARSRVTPDARVAPVVDDPRGLDGPRGQGTTEHADAQAPAFALEDDGVVGEAVVDAHDVAGMDVRELHRSSPSPTER